MLLRKPAAASIAAWRGWSCCCAGLFGRSPAGRSRGLIHLFTRFVHPRNVVHVHVHHSGYFRNALFTAFYEIFFYKNRPLQGDTVVSPLNRKAALYLQILRGLNQCGQRLPHCRAGGNVIKLRILISNARFSPTGLKHFIKVQAFRLPESYKK